ncbi:hypothetical protein BKA66DRAFT_544961 [Pyrenochaeta sp. MPI-SDFR-AT-0127]|nr:hypothetical protein BKA66DRAFT_544961 [Pyrenochaeta sp. MPI-SDFR-AT-0127]
MAYFQYSFLALLSTLLHFVTTIQAQSNETNLTACGDKNSNTVSNSTGHRRFRLSNPDAGGQDSYLSVTLQDTRNSSPVEAPLQGISGYISAPANVQAQVCSHMFRGINATAGTGSEDCEGIISQDCVNYLRRETRLLWSWTSDGRRRLSCHVRPGNDELRRSCGSAGNAGNGIISFTSQIDTINTNCVNPSPPGIELPDSYRTHGLGSFGPASDAGDGKYGDFGDYSTYDLHVRQTMLWVITGFFNDNTTEAYALCLAPNIVAEGSRIPQGPFPETSGAREKLPSTWHLATIVVEEIL